jgi:hypothetical protein
MSFVVVATAVLGITQDALAQAEAGAPLLDQQAPVATPQPFTWALGGASKQVLYQSFIVGLDGRLVELRLPIGCESGEVVLQIFDANSDGLPIPGTEPRLTRSFAADTFPDIVLDDFHPLPLGSSVSVSAGERLVFVLSNPAGSCGIGGSVAGDAYLRGTGYGDDTTDPFPPVPLNISPTNPDDLPFQTFVRVTGLITSAMLELRDAGVDKYLGTSQSFVSNHGVWTRHDFDRNYVPDPTYPAGSRPDGPVCIAGTPYSVFTRQGDPQKLLIFLQGGGACWQGSNACNILAEVQAPPPEGQLPGVFDTTMVDNPFADYSVVYMPYCDGSTFSGDNDVVDPEWQAFLETVLGLEPGTGPLVRFHRGLRNASAGMDVAADMFPEAKQITVMGHSAGGVGAAAFAPFLARFVFGNNTRLTVYNDAGPIAVNLGTPPTAGGPDASWLSVSARQNDWQFQQFYPQSCVDDGRCNAFGQQTGIIDWRLEKDSTIREAFYETDSDRTNRRFAQGDGSFMDPEAYRALILAAHGALNEKYPRRYRRFIVSADDTHGAVQVTAATPNFPFLQEFSFYTQEANGMLLVHWVTEFVSINQRQSKFGWNDIVEDYVPVPIP